MLEEAKELLRLSKMSIGQLKIICTNKFVFQFNLLIYFNYLYLKGNVKMNINLTYCSLTRSTILICGQFGTNLLGYERIISRSFSYYYQYITITCLSFIRIICIM